MSVASISPVTSYTTENHVALRNDKLAEFNSNTALYATVKRNVDGAVRMDSFKTGQVIGRAFQSAG